nr:hypothetical protein CFP56_24551 [Quercus suber]
MWPRVYEDVNANANANAKEASPRGSKSDSQEQVSEGRHVKLWARRGAFFKVPMPSSSLYVRAQAATTQAGADKAARRRGIGGWSELGRV